MSGYDSQKFSREFSIRTETNLNYIQRVVNQEKLEFQFREEFVLQYQQILDQVKDVVDTIRKDTNTMPSMQKKGKNELKSRMYSLASKLESSKIILEKELNELVSTQMFHNDKLYEVTQLLNSLMGIAVLPYEMHKEYFIKLNDENDMSEENRGKSLSEIRNEVKRSDEYKAMQSYVMNLYKNGKWASTYSSDLDLQGEIKKNNIVFGFLRHLRNATCHSGDNAISILPLNEGQVIREIIFYDKMENDGNTYEFAMRLSIEDLQQLIVNVAEFYRNTKIGFIDKTINISNAENRVNTLLNTYHKIKK